MGNVLLNICLHKILLIVKLRQELIIVHEVSLSEFGNKHLCYNFSRSILVEIEIATTLQPHEPTKQKGTYVYEKNVTSAA